MKSKMSALNITGTNAKVVAKEVFNALYEMTKTGDNPKVVTDALTAEYLKIDPKNITRSLLVSLFADTVDSSNINNTKKHKSRYNSWDKFTIPAGYFYESQPEINTTIGRFFVNKFVLEGSGIISETKYQDKIFNKKNLGDFDDFIAELLMTDRITRDQFNSYIDHRDTIGYWLNGILAHTISQRMLRPLDEITKKKQELFKKYQKELEGHNIDAMTKVSDELVAYAKEILKGDPGMDLYDSGDLDFGNNYKNNAIVKGAVMNKITNEFDFIGSSFMDGIEIKDIPAHANSILASQYPASIATAGAGYLGKRLLALLQMMEVDEEGTDCGTKNLMPVKITPWNKKFMLYTYIDNGAGELIMLDNSNIGSYVGQTVMMRTPMSCTSDKICSKCAGNLFYMLGVKHAGLFATQISHADLNLALKAKHNSLVNLYTIDPDDMMTPIE